MGAELFYLDRRTEGKTDVYDEANSRFSQFYECSSKCTSPTDMSRSDKLTLLVLKQVKLEIVN